MIEGDLQRAQRGEHLAALQSLSVDGGNGVGVGATPNLSINKSGLRPIFSRDGPINSIDFITEF